MFGRLRRRCAHCCLYVPQALVALRHVLLAHAAAVSSYRKQHQQATGGRIGIVLNTRHYTAVDSSEVAKSAAQHMLEMRIACWSDPLVHGIFPAPFVQEHAGNAALDFSESDWRQLRGSIDFLGINYYTTSGVQATDDGQWQIVDVGEASGAALLRSYPAGFLELLRWLNGRYPGLDIVITENGMCTASSDADPLEDSARVDYYDKHVAAVQQAVDEGLPVRGYFVWTFLDNFEWTGGYKERFGIIHVDFAKGDRPRTVKRSYRWWQRFLEKRDCSTDL